jgi:GNAT superfamily N-acetyltransferase
MLILNWVRINIMQLRRAVPSDMDFLLEGMEKNRVLELRPPEGVKAKQEDIQDFKESIKKASIRVIEDGGKPVAFLHFKTDFKVMYVPGRVFWVDLVYVRERHRSRGLGKMLYEEAFRIAREKGFKKVLIDIFDVNKGSRAFHKKLGFRPVYTIYEKSI